jgi:hypothetical protein
MWLVLATLAASALGGTRLLATVVPWMSLDEMAGAAEVIAAGRVESVEPGPSDDGRLIVTRTTLAVERTLKGRPGRRLVVETPGGTLGDRTLIASGAPVFIHGDRVVLFLQPAGRREGAGAPRFAIVGWNQGRFAVRRDPRTGRDLVDDRSGGALYLDGNGRPVDTGRLGAGPVPLDRFLEEVEGRVKREAEGKAP